MKFFTARNTFIAESSLEEIAAIDFDAWIIQLFGAIGDIDREVWEMADRLYALNSALDQQAERRENGQIYVRLDALPDGKMRLSLIEPLGQDEEGESAIKRATIEDTPPGEGEHSMYDGAGFVALLFIGLIAFVCLYAAVTPPKRRTRRRRRAR